MTDSQIEQWKRERDIARAIADPESRKVALEKVYDHRDEMQMTCIAHQSSRQKELIADVSQLKVDVANVRAEVKPLQAMKKEVDEGKLKFKGAKFGFGLAMILVGKFGWDAVNSIWVALTHGVSAAH